MNSGPILVVDDDPNILDIVAELLLDMEGYRVATAANGAETYVAKPFEVPLLDAVEKLRTN